MHEMRQRRFLPSLSQLLAFEAVMRSHSVTAAAEELSLTQSTVSRLVQSLEGQLEVELFLRQRRRLVPTSAAEAYFADVTRGLDLIQRASMGVVANPGGGGLSLAVLPTFATRWLGPRLGGFMAEAPGVSVNLATRIGRFDFGTEAFDAAIFFGKPDWPETRHMKLFDERLTACASRGFLDRHRPATPADVASLPLLQLESRPRGWNDWFAAQGAPGRGEAGMVMDQFSMMIQAAISGLGVALLPEYLARAEIDECRLLPLFREAVPSDGAYWLVWPEAKDRYAPLLRFREWIASEEPPHRPV